MLVTAALRGLCTRVREDSARPLALGIFLPFGTGVCNPAALPQQNMPRSVAYRINWVGRNCRPSLVGDNELTSAAFGPARDMRYEAATH